MTADTLRARTCKDLAALARKHGVSGWHDMRKDQLIRALVRAARKNNGRPASNGQRVAPSPNGVSQNGAARNGNISRHVGGHNGTSASRTAASNGSSHSARENRPNIEIKQFRQVRQFGKNLASSRAAKAERVKDRLVVMVRDSYWLHAYWELRRQSIDRAAAAMGQQWHTARPVLRLSEVISDGTTNTTERMLRDIDIHGGVSNWYLHVDAPQTSYRVAVGYVGTDETGNGGQFYTLARSNVVTPPAPDASDDLDRNWDDVARNFDKIYAMSGGYDEGSSAGDLKELFEERLRRPMGSGHIARFAVGAPVLGHHGDRFHFEVDAEMIVYGVATPDARVTMRGEPVQLRADGSFTVRMSLPDRRQVIPVVANSVDGSEQRTIVLGVERNTKVMETLIREPEDPLAD